MTNINYKSSLLQDVGSEMCPDDMNSDQNIRQEKVHTIKLSSNWSKTT